MAKRSFVIGIVTHVIAGVVGFAIGIYTLPILIAPDAPDMTEVEEAASLSMFTGQFERNRKDSDAFHWGEGKVSIGSDFVTFMGNLAPGPDYRLYLSPEFVETEVDFNRLKSSMVHIGDVKTFENFVVKMPQGVDPSKYTTAIVWCESFGEFITSASYQ